MCALILGVGSVDDITWISNFDIARINIMKKYNLKAVIGCFSVGTPDVTNPSIIQAYYPAIDAALANDGILGLHEYR